MLSHVVLHNAREQDKAGRRRRTVTKFYCKNNPPRHHAKK